ncbi:MAG: serine--tRNA ligase [Planctomycetota bacterium]|nr:MAG: serine--tRNA ligase [Planctomycetota bacterium]
MLDIRFIRENLDYVKKQVARKGYDLDLDALVSLDERRRSLITQGESLRAEQKKRSKELGKLKGDEKQSALAALKEMSDRYKVMSEELRRVEEKFNDMMLRVPNMPARDAPDGETEEDNLEVKRWGEPREFDFEPLDHVQLGESLGIIDIKRGVKISGTRSYVLKGDGALLEWAALKYALDTIVSKGFVPMVAPILVRDFAMVGTAFYPGGEEDAYRCERDELNLVGTSEVPVTSYHSDEILDEKDLPRRYAGISSCFRREAGTYGKDTKGVYRVHQFQKIEQVVFCKNDVEESARMHEYILANAEEVVQGLGLPYRVVSVCVGELGMGRAKQYDIETWMPSRNSYGETHSASRYHDYQARRLNIRYRDSEGNIRFVHTLNNTVIASPRILIPILENYQNADGSVTIPEVLRPYMNGRERIEPPR